MMKRTLFGMILLAATFQANAEPCMLIFKHSQLIMLPAVIIEADQVTEILSYYAKEITPVR